MPMAYAMVSTYPPTQCGLATFSASLCAHLPGPEDQVGVVRVLDEPHPYRADLVVHDLVNGSVSSTASAARVLNGFDVVIVQHEYGIYGGPDGQDLLMLLDALERPSIAVLHTVLAHPSPRQRRVLDEVTAAAKAVVTMSATARSRLLDIYGTSPQKTFVIPHGAVDNRVAVQRQGHRPIVLTWGLLGPGKGVEHAIEAVAMLRGYGVDADYVVAGQTHPRVRGRDGEAYRSGLMARAYERGVADRVHFEGRYLSAQALRRLIAAADVVLLPYDSAEQVTSGVLIEAVAAGKPVIATRFPHAVELLSGGAGLLVDRENPVSMASALLRVFTERGVAARMSAHASALAPRLLWPAVAESYRELAGALVTTRSGAPV